MSIQWEAFNGDMVITRKSLVVELKRITVMPPHSSMAQFLEVYAKEAEETNDPSRAAILKYCMTVWVYRLYIDRQDATEDGIQTLKHKMEHFWATFVEWVDKLSGMDCVQP